MLGGHFLLVVELFCIYLICNVCSRRPSRKYQNVHLLDTGSRNKPLVVFLDLTKKTTGPGRLDDDVYYEYENRDNHDERDDESGSVDKYFVQQLLKNFQQEDRSSSSENEDAGKVILRSALRARCQKVDKCAQKCPPRKPQCPQKCKEDYDKNDLCPPPPPPDPCAKKKCCNKPKCGKTLPPRWRF